MEQLRGKLRQKVKNGAYYYRLMVTNGVRKEFSLNTHDLKEACAKAAELDALWEAPTKEVAVAQIAAIKGVSRQAVNLPLDAGWEKYEIHPEKAHPHTIHEQEQYRTTLNEFIEFATGKRTFPARRTRPVSTFIEIDRSITSDFANYLKTTQIAVDTHNRKIKRLRKIFDCLKDYYEGENPFRSKTLLRNPREEQDNIVRRQAFTQEQEQQLRDVLADTKHRVMNKREIRCIYYIGMYAGQRLKDCVLLQWQNVDMVHQRIFVKQFKTGKEVSFPMAPQLYEVLKEAKTWRVNQYVCPKSAARYNKTNDDGKNVGNNLVDLDVLRVIRWIGLEPSVDVPGRKKKMTVYGFHSLKHSFCSFCAEAGVPKAVLISILGTDSDIADKYYTHVGESAQRQAIAAVSGVSSEKSAQDKINEALMLLKTSPEVPADLRKKLIEILG